jgi:hypothetical protein
MDELERRLAAIEQRLEAVEAANERQNTELSAQNQALAALGQSKKNRALIDLVDRKLNFFACFITAALLIYFGANHTELEIARWLVLGAIACGVYGLLVISEREDLIIQILPFLRR